MLKKAKLYSLLALIVASTVVGLVIPSIPASAQTDTDSTLPALYINPSIEADVNAKNLREAMVLCLRYNEISHGATGMPAADLSNGKWFTNGEVKASVGYIADNGDPYYACSDGDNGTKLINKFLSVYTTWETPFEAACALGYLPSTTNFSGDEQDCLDSDGVEGVTYALRTGNNDREARRKAIDNARTWGKAAGSGGIGDKTPVQQYVLYMRTFQLACSPTSAIIESELKVGDENNHEKVAIVDGHGKSTNVYFIVPDLTSPKKVRVASISDSPNENKNCQELVDAINASAPDYAKYVKDLGLTPAEIDQGTDSLTPGGSATSSSPSTCRIDGVGWLICPFLNFLANVVDDSYELLDNSLLKTTPLIIGNTSGDRNQLYDTWKEMRDFANVAFVAAFLIIIFSQITSIGLSNYGLKRLLPKLLIAAVLVNLSYFICAIAIDLSNILGSSIKNLLSDTIGDTVIPDAPGSFEIPSTNIELSDGSTSDVVGWKGLTAAVLAGSVFAGGPFALLAFLVPLLFAAISAVVAVVVTLVIRQVLIILLVVIAPLAFVALLLPNTEDYYKKWQTTFKTLLLLYPVIAIVFGASALASKIIIGSASDADGAAKIFIQLAGSAAAVIPLFITPALMKLGGGVLSRFAGMANDPNKGLLDRGRNASLKGLENRQKGYEASALDGKWRLGGAKIKRGVRSKERTSNIEGDLALATAKFNATENVAKAKDSNDPATMRRGARSQATLDKLDNQSVDDAVDLMKAGIAPGPKLLDHAAEELKEANTSGDSVRARAAAKILAQAGGRGNKILDETLQEMINDSPTGSLNSAVDSELKSSLIGSKSINGARELWALNLSKDINSGYSSGTVEGLTAQELGSQKDHVLEAYAKNGAISSDAAKSVLAAAPGGGFSLTEKNKKMFEDIAAGVSPSPPSSGTTTPSPSPAGGGATPSTPTGSVAAPTGAGATTTPPSSPPTTPAPSTGSPAAAATPAPTAAPAFGQPLPISYTDRTKPADPLKVKVAIDVRGGVSALSDKDIAAIANIHGAHPVGQDAKAEIDRRGGAKALADRRRAAITPSPPTRADDV